MILKAVNALLKALDRLQCRSNLLLFCTSKYVQSLVCQFQWLRFLRDTHINR